jgi:hypothetical protein
VKLRHRPSSPSIPRDAFDYEELDGCVSLKYDIPTFFGWTFPFQTSYIYCKVLLDTGFQKVFVRLRSSADAFRLPRTGTEKIPRLRGRHSCSCQFW